MIKRTKYRFVIGGILREEYALENKGRENFAQRKTKLEIEEVSEELVYRLMQSKRRRENEEGIEIPEGMGLFEYYLRLKER